MTCPCGEPVNVKKHGLCLRCYQTKRRLGQIDTTPRYTTLQREQDRKDRREARDRAKATKTARLVAKMVERSHQLEATCRSYADAYAEGLTMQAVGDRFGVCRERVRQRLARLGIQGKPKGQRSATKPRSRRTKAQWVSDLRTTYNATIRDRIRDRCRMTDSGCWHWTGSCAPTNKNYPDYVLPRMCGYDPHDAPRRRLTYAYRIAYIVFKGPIPKGMTVDHICFNPMCCNPEHLQLLTHSENAARKSPQWLERVRAAAYRRKEKGALPDRKGAHNSTTLGDDRGELPTSTVPESPTPGATGNK